MWSNFREFLVLYNLVQAVQIIHARLGPLGVPLLASSGIPFSVLQSSQLLRKDVVL